MKSSVLYIFLIICLFSISCRELPTEKSNSLDPASENYGPEAPIIWGSQFEAHSNLLNWQNRSPNAEGFKIERLRDSLQGFITIGEQSTKMSGYIDKDSLLVKGTVVTYRVRAYLGLKVGLPSNEVTIKMRF